MCFFFFFFFSSRRRHTRSYGDWSSDVCSSDLELVGLAAMVEPDVVVVPAGDALLGDPPRTEHVNVFAIARKPVSVGEYAMFVDATRHERSEERRVGKECR